MRRLLAFRFVLFFMICFMVIISPVTSIVNATQPIHIKSDGSLEGTNVIRIEGDTYTLTVDIYNSSGIIVEKDNIIIDGAGCTLQGEGTSIGIEVMYRTNVTIRNTQIVNFEYGVILDGSTGCIVSQNILKCNTLCGIWIYRSNNNIVNENNVTQNANSGIQMDRASNNSISGNNINENMAGIWINGAENTTFHGNNIEDNTFYGVMFTKIYSSTNNIFYENNLVNNPQQVVTNGQQNAWDNGTHGNFWNDNSGSDLNNDGISDFPYTIDDDNTDQKPLMDQLLIPEFPTKILFPIFVVTTIAIVIIKKKVSSGVVRVHL